MKRKNSKEEVLADLLTSSKRTVMAVEAWQHHMEYHLNKCVDQACLLCSRHIKTTELADIARQAMDTLMQYFHVDRTVGWGFADYV